MEALRTDRALTGPSKMPRHSLDSRDLAERMGLRHHNVLRSIDRVLRQCPNAAPHYRFEQHPVTAGLGGRRLCRHALIDREGFMLLAMGLPAARREAALRLAAELSPIPLFPKGPLPVL